MPHPHGPADATTSEPAPTGLQPRTPLTLTKVGTFTKPLTGTTEADYDTGQVIYRMDKVGAFTVCVHDRGWPAPTETAMVVFGADYGPRAQFRYHDRDVAERPVVNGVVIGEATTWGPDDKPSPYSNRVRRHSSNADVPPRTTLRVTSILAAIIAHWNARPDRHLLQYGADRSSAEQRMTDRLRAKERLTRNLAALQADLAVVMDEMDLLTTMLPPNWLDDCASLNREAAQLKETA